MDRLEIMLDGINVQQAGELLLDEPKSTRNVRRLCFATYYKSLEDFAFAAIFGGKIITTGALVDVDNGHPGEHLLGKNYFSHIHERRIPASSTGGWEDLLEHETDRQALASLLSSLDRVGTNDSIYWRLQVIREVFLYFGTDKSLEKGGAGAEYIFKGRGNFRRDEELQGKVPPSHWRPIVNWVKVNRESLPGVAKAHDDAIREFIGRNALAHLGIYRWYSQTGEKALNAQVGIRIPHVTRQSLPNVERALWMIRNMTIPSLLDSMARDSRSRNELTEKLLAASKDTTYDALREKLAASWQLAMWGHTSQLDKLIADVQEEIDARKLLKIRDVAVAVGGNDSAYRNALRMLAVRGAGPRQIVPDYSHVFEELKGGTGHR
jgi:hypothetical protein